MATGDDETREDVPLLESVEPGDYFVRQQPRPGFWGAVGWCFLFVVVLLIGFAVGSIGDIVIQASQQNDVDAFLKKLGDLGEDGKQFSPELLQALRVGMLWAEVLTVLFALLVLRLKLGADWRRKIACVLPRLDHAIVAVLAIPGFIIFSGLLGFVFRLIIHGGAANAPDMDLGRILGDMLKPWPVWLSVLVIGVGPGIGEELWCRGFLGRGLIGRYGVVFGVLATSLLFGCMHGPDPAYILVTLCMGLFLHMIYLATRSLMLSMFVHFANNSIATLLALGQLDLPFLNADAELPPIAITLSAVALFAAAAYAFYVGRAYLVDREDHDGSFGPIWRRAMPGAELPPANSRTAIAHASIMGLPLALVVLTHGVFLLSCYLS